MTGRRKMFFLTFINIIIILQESTHIYSQTGEFLFLGSF